MALSRKHARILAAIIVLTIIASALCQSIAPFVALLCVIIAAAPTALMFLVILYMLEKPKPDDATAI